MKISILKPCAMITSQDGSTTQRMRAGDQVELSSDWEKAVATKMVKLGLAMEVGGNAGPTETKKAPAKKRTPRKTTAKKA